MAVLDSSRGKLQENALRIAVISRMAERMMERHRLDRRRPRLGLFLGVDSSATGTKDGGLQASYSPRIERILLSTDGPFHNVLKIKRRCVSRRRRRPLVETLDRVLSKMR